MGLTRKVSPTTHEGLPPPEPMLEPSPRSKMPPRHILSATVPRFISSGLMGQELPPNDSETLTVVEQAIGNIQSD